MSCCVSLGAGHKPPAGVTWKFFQSWKTDPTDGIISCRSSNILLYFFAFQLALFGVVVSVGIWANELFKICLEKNPAWIWRLSHLCKSPSSWTPQRWSNRINQL